MSVKVPFLYGKPSFVIFENEPSVSLTCPIEIKARVKTDFEPTIFGSLESTVCIQEDQ